MPGSSRLQYPLPSSHNPPGHIMSAPRARSLLLLSAATTIGLLSLSPTAYAQDKPATGYENIVTNPIRTDADRGMDASRHPVEFLAFAQAKPGMQVMDVSAGAGYTTQIL